MEGKKISFGFMKTKKVEKLLVQEKKDFIECVEEKSIKVVGGDDVKEIAPLVITMKPNTLITAERLKQIAEKVESSLVEEPEKVEAPLTSEKTTPENETLDQMAVRELLEDSKKAVKVHTPQLTLVLPAKSVSSGEKESTLDDYESIPVQEFGLAMLRGMGWTKTNEKSTYKPPQLRLKGLGLGADKVVKDNNKQKATKNNRDEELTIVKNAFVKITTGRYSGYYGKVLSLDEDNGRVMVDIAVKNETVSLSEFMMHPVTKSEFDKESKVINANSFDQYKKNEEQKSSKSLDKPLNRGQEKNWDEKEANSSSNNNHKRTDNESNRDRLNRDRHKDSSHDKYNRKKNKRDSSNESMNDSDSDRDKKMEQKSKKRYSSLESLDSDTEKKYKKKERGKRDSDQELERRSKKVKDRKRRDSISDTEKKSKKKDRERKRYDTDFEADRISKNKDKERTRHVSSSESDYERNKRSNTPDGKRDIDKKRKGKKKKRDRDRSPNYRKHRK